jgi:hypothetical protein
MTKKQPKSRFAYGAEDMKGLVFEDAKKYSPDQPRDEGGRFSSGGGSDGGNGDRGSWGWANRAGADGNAERVRVYIPSNQEDWESAGDLRAVPNMNDDDLKGWRDEYRGSTDDHERSMSRAARAELERREVQRARVGNALGGKPKQYGLYDNSPEATAHRQSLMDASNHQATALGGSLNLLGGRLRSRGAFKSAFFKADGVDESMGLVFGWAIVCKEDGAEYFDVQGDHIPEVSMLKAAADFMENSRVIKEMHAGDDKGFVVFAWPMTEDVAKAMGITTKRTGLMIAVKPDDPAVLDKFKSGEYSGFSIGGTRVRDKDVEG